MASSAELELRRFTALEVQRMVDAGILREDEPVELVEGALVVVSPQGPKHTTAMQIVSAKLQGSLGDRGHVRVQMPVAANETSLPEPDVAVVRGEIRDYSDAHPRGEDCILVVEIAVTSQIVDRAKAATYAAAGVEVYWLLDVPARRLEVRTHPNATRTGYAVTTLLDETEEIHAPGVDGAWRVSELLP